MMATAEAAEAAEAAEKLTIRPEYRGLTGIERYCREECSRSGPASVWRVYAYLWAHHRCTGPKRPSSAEPA